jgi:hypothetical protein
MLTSHYLLILIDKAASKAKRRALEHPVTQQWDKYTLVPKKLEDIGMHKSFEWVRPEHMEPTGNVSLDAVHNKIIGQLSRCEEHLSELKNGEGTLCLTTMTVNDIGKLDVYQYIYFLILHAKRHLRQLESNKITYHKSRQL